MVKKEKRSNMNTGEYDGDYAQACQAHSIEQHRKMNEAKKIALTMIHKNERKYALYSVIVVSVITIWAFPNMLFNFVGILFYTLLYLKYRHDSKEKLFEDIKKLDV